jgi:MauM/NapG family ferredoxin protein
MTGFATNRREFLRRFAGGALAVAGTLGAAGWMLRGTAARAEPCVRPPGALTEDDFLATCIRCGRCADACPNRCITAFTEEAGQELAMQPGFAQRGTPVIFPRRQACILCNGAPGDKLLCGAACPTGALQVVPKEPAAIREQVKMGVAEVDTNLCYSYNGASCGACVRACPFEGVALKAGLWEKPIVNPDACIGCGLCERACVRYPQAIRVRPVNAV